METSNSQNSSQQSVKLVTEHAVILCAEKRERVMALETLLKQAGVIVYIANSVYDAVRQAEQELPHLIITEPALSDGPASLLCDRLQQHKQLQRIPVALLFSKLAKEEAAALVKRRLAGLFSTTLDPRVIAEKAIKVLRGESGFSPHFLGWKESLGDAKVNFSAESVFIGRIGPFAVSRSAFEVDTGSPVRCALKPIPEAPVILSATTNLRLRDDVYSLFPLYRVLGQPRGVLGQLQDITGASGGSSAAPSGAGAGGVMGASKIPRIVVLVSADSVESNSWQKILAAYHWKVVAVPSFAAGASYAVKIRTAAFWLLSNGEGDGGITAEMKSAYASIPVNARPVLILPTSSVQSISRDNVCYLRQDFGLGGLLDTLESTLWRSSDFSNSSANTGAGVPASWSDSATLIGCDERSWFLRSASALVKGTKISIHQPGRESFWSSMNLIVGHCFPESSGGFSIRLDSVVVGASKLRYLEKIARELGLDMNAVA